MTKSTFAIDALTQFAAKVDEVIKSSPLADVEKNAKQQFVSQLAKHGLITREEFDIQATMLEKARAKLQVLEARVAELEAVSVATAKTKS